MNETLHARPAVAHGTASARPGEAAAQFLLRAPGHALVASGCQARLPPGALASLATRVADFFARPRQGPGLLVGAIPFDPAQDDCLYQPAALDAPAASELPAAPRLLGEVVAEPSAAMYRQAVGEAIQQMGRPGASLHKVVLARSLRVQTDTAFSPQALAARLGHDPSVATYIVPVPGEAGSAPAWLVGATPELLLSKRGDQVLSHPLAGSARRSADPAEDARAAQALLASAKDHDEHRHVVDAIVQGLAPWCTQVTADARPSLHATASMWHLGTRIHGTLRDPGTSAASLLAVLHPTPAVCGTPPDAALALIRALEPVPRGFYAGAVGWTDAHGDGDWYVAIRCARVQGTELRLFAGAGVVSESTPALEAAETAAKFMALLTALGADDARFT